MDARRTFNPLTILPLVTVVFLLAPLLGAFYYNQTHSVGWFIQALVSTLCLTLFLFSICSFIKYRWLRSLFGTVLIGALGIFLLTRLMSFYFQGESFNERFFFHANMETFETGAGSFPLLLVFSAFYISLLAISAAVSLYFIHQVRLLKVPVSLSLMLIAGILLEPDINVLVRTTLASGDEQVDVLSLKAAEEGGLNLNALEQRLDGVDPGKNLLLIYLESLEKVYTEESIFPGLTPYLNTLKSEGLYFSDLQQTSGTSWTIAGMMASQCGSPLLSPFGPTGNELLQGEYMNNIVCIGDLLKQADYEQSYIGGASIKFAGKGKFYSLHGFDRVRGVDELAPLLEDANYVNNWGLFDDSMFNFATEEFNRLAANDDRPFNLTLLTVDTHHPAGTPSKTCPRYEHIDNSILHSVHCSDFLLKKFIEGIKDNPAYDDTLVVITSDHLAMRNIAEDYYPEDYEREIYTVILNADEQEEFKEKASHMDLAPTILSLMDVRHQQEFLAGDNLMNPAIHLREVDYADPERLSMIRSINANFFTRLTNNVCNQPPLFSVSNNSLQRGNKPMYLGVGGRAIPLENLLAKHASLTFLLDDGTIQSTQTVNTRNLPFVFYQGKSYHFLAIAPSEAAKVLLPDADIKDGVAVLSGNGTGNISLLGSFDNMEDLYIDTDCDSLLSKDVISDANNVSNKRAFMLESFCPADSEVFSRYDAEADRIYLDKVGVDNSWYSAELLGKGKGRYQLVKQSLIGLIDPDEPLSYCHAYYSRSEVLIPRILTGNGAESMVLREEAGNRNSFILENTTLN